MLLPTSKSKDLYLLEVLEQYDDFLLDVKNSQLNNEEEKKTKSKFYLLQNIIEKMLSIEGLMEYNIQLISKKKI